MKKYMTMKLNVKILVALGFLYCLLYPGKPGLSQSVLPDDPGLVYHWTFDMPLEKGQDSYTGSFEGVPGVHGEALKFDGFTTCIEKKLNDTPNNRRVR